MAKRKNKEAEYRAAVEAVADAAERVEEARRKFDEGWRALGQKKSDAEKAMREALDSLQRKREERNGKS
jgi:tryptophanyl-tRNA synthetase